MVRFPLRPYDHRGLVIEMRPGPRRIRSSNVRKSDRQRRVTISRDERLGCQPRNVSFTDFKMRARIPSVRLRIVRGVVKTGVEVHKRQFMHVLDDDGMTIDFGIRQYYTFTQLQATVVGLA